MIGVGSSELIHLVGFLTGAMLYGMLLVMATRAAARPDAFALAAGVLGLVWNLGELGALTIRAAGPPGLIPWVHALSFTSLGFLAAIVVHSVSPAPSDAARWRRRCQAAIPIMVYGCSVTAAVMHLSAAAAGAALPSSTGLTVLTAGLLAVIPLLIAFGRQQLNSPRALWMAALAVVAVSALHLGTLHGTEEPWPVELVGHHASISLAFAILYQDYRFAFADLFLKQALALLVLVALVFGGFSMIEPLLGSTRGALQPTAVAILLAIWAATALVFPLCRRGVVRFVDRVVLARADYAALLTRLADDVQHDDTPETILERVCAVLSPALTASSVTWEERASDALRDVTPQHVPVWTTEAPHYVLTVGPLAGGRRLLSDDIAMLERVAIIAARRIDAVRLAGERSERMMQEREMRALATEAELRALRAQLHPHFLFNALTTIGYLIQHAPSRALKTLVELTTLLRSVLRSEGDFTTLGRERDLIQCYLKIERERFEERLVFDLDVPDYLAHMAIPSLIVQPLVENAVKHGIATTRGGGTILVSARLDSELRVMVRNTGAPLGAGTATDGGIGLENVRRRLQHYYGSAASLDVARDDSGATVAALRLPTGDADDEDLQVSARSAAR